LIKFSCDLVDRGWIEVKLCNGEIDKYITASYLSDAVRDFIIAVTLVLNDSKNISCNWQEEPGEFRFVFTKEDIFITLRIIKFNTTFSTNNDNSGDLVFEGTEELIRFAKNVKQQYDRLLYKYGEEGYKKNWNYEFPLEELNCLNLAIIEHQPKDND